MSQAAFHAIEYWSWPLVPAYRSSHVFTTRMTPLAWLLIIFGIGALSSTSITATRIRLCCHFLELGWCAELALTTYLLMSSVPRRLGLVIPLAGADPLPVGDVLPVVDDP